jgi:hypothetical protein
MFWLMRKSPNYQNLLQQQKTGPCKQLVSIGNLLVKGKFSESFINFVPGWHKLAFLTFSIHCAKRPLLQAFIDHHHEVSSANTKHQHQHQHQYQHPPYNLEQQHATGVV